MEDHHLAAAAARGDGEALATLVERYRFYVYAIAYKIALDQDDAFDIAQNVFMRLVERIGQFAGRGTFRAWLATMTSREAMSFLRHRSRREIPTEPETLEVLSDESQHDRTGNPRRNAETAERREMVESVMGTLSPQQRAIFTLRFREDMGPKEIGDRLGIPPRRVCVHLHRAIARIRRALLEKGVL